MKKSKLEEYSHLKLWSMCNCNISWEFDSFYVFLLILLDSMLFSVSNRFYVTSDWWISQWGKTDWIQFVPETVFSKRDCPLVWKLVEYTFNH